MPFRSKKNDSSSLSSGTDVKSAKIPGPQQTSPPPDPDDPEYLQSITTGYTSSGLPKRKGQFQGGPRNENLYGGLGADSIIAPRPGEWFWQKVADFGQSRRNKKKAESSAAPPKTLH